MAAALHPPATTTSPTHPRLPDAQQAAHHTGLRVLHHAAHVVDVQRHFGVQQQLENAGTLPACPQLIADIPQPGRPVVQGGMRQQAGGRRLWPSQRPGRHQRQRILHSCLVAPVCRGSHQLEGQGGWERLCTLLPQNSQQEGVGCPAAVSQHQLQQRHGMRRRQRALPGPVRLHHALGQGASQVVANEGDGRGVGWQQRVCPRCKQLVQ